MGRVRAAVAGVLASVVVLSGCATQGEPGAPGEDRTINSDEIIAAVKADVPRVTEVAEATSSRDGLGRTLYLELRTESTEPFTADELQGVLRAVWSTADFHPVDVDITAQDAATGEVAVDLTQAADELLDGDYNTYGDRGITTTGITRLLGPWPER